MCGKGQIDERMEGGSEGRGGGEEAGRTDG